METKKDYREVNNIYSHIYIHNYRYIYIYKTKMTSCHKKPSVVEVDRLKK